MSLLTKMITFTSSSYAVNSESTRRQQGRVHKTPLKCLFLQRLCSFCIVQLYFSFFTCDKSFPVIMCYSCANWFYLIFCFCPEMRLVNILNAQGRQFRVTPCLCLILHLYVLCQPFDRSVSLCPFILVSLYQSGATSKSLLDITVVHNCSIFITASR